MDGNTTWYWIRHSRPRRHKSFISESCFRFNCNPFGIYIRDKEEACTYVKTTESCAIIVNFINYLEIMVCDLNLHDSSYMIIWSLLVVSFFTVILFVTGKYFMVPNMLTMAQNSRMTEYSFGFTVISGILVIPFLLDTAVTCKSNSALSAMYVADWISVVFTIITIGFIVISTPHEVTFRVSPGRFCWNMFMIGFGLITLFFVLTAGNVAKSTLNELSFTLLFGSFYIGYIIYLRKTHTLSRRITIKRLSMQSDDYDPTPEYQTITADPWEIFYQTISPYRVIVDNPLLFYLLTPFWVAISLFVPVVTQTRPLNGWCKITTMINFLLFPLLSYALPSTKLFYFLGVVCILITLIIGICTYFQHEPPFHNYLAIFGFIVGIYIVVEVDNEIRCLFWQVLSYVADWRVDAVFMVSPIACIVIQILIIRALVKKHQQELAYGIIFGTMTLIIYFAYPTIAFFLCFQRVNMTPITANTQTTYIFLLLTLALSFVGVCFADFQIRKSHAYFLGAMFITYFIFIICSALQLIHPLGSYHSIFFVSTSESDWA